MKLSRRIILSVSIALVALFALWALVFYQSSKRRIYSRIDKVLVEQSDKIIGRFVDNDSLPNSISGMSGTVEFFIEKVSPEYAQNHQNLFFHTHEDYIDAIQDEETVMELNRVFEKQGIDYEIVLTTQVFAWNDTLDFAVFSIFTLAFALLLAIILIVSIIILNNMGPNWPSKRWPQKLSCPDGQTQSRPQSRKDFTILLRRGLSVYTQPPSPMVM